MRTPLALLLVGLTACAPHVNPAASVLTDGSHDAAVMTSNLQVVTATVSYPLARAWELMPAVYDSLGIQPITSIDPARHTIALEGAKIRRRLGTVSLSRYIDCGQAQIGPSADSYDIVLAVTTQLSAVPTGTQLATTVEALAKSPSFAQDYSRCSSTGTLEKRISDLLRQRLASR